MLLRLSLLAFVFASPGVLAVESTDFINLQKYDYTIKQDIKYATPDNFTKKVIYPEAKCVLRRSVAEALGRVQVKVKLQQMSLKVYDCYRPLSVQKILWDLVKDERYVANPEKGSRHNRGAAVDVTLVDSTGVELDMPTKYDNFSDRAHRNSKKMTKRQRKNMLLLENAMVSEGFIPMPTEWWHFDDKGWESFPLSDEPLSNFP